MVKQNLNDHPFIRQGKPSNAVLGSLVLAHAVIQGLLGGANMRLLADLSRQPFLWRFLRSQIERSSDVLVDGRYAGYILNSYWNDPIVRNPPPVVIRSVEEGAAGVHVPIDGGGEVVFKIAFPFSLYGQRACSAFGIQRAIR